MGISKSRFSIGLALAGTTLALSPEVHAQTGAALAAPQPPASSAPPQNGAYGAPPNAAADAAAWEQARAYAAWQAANRQWALAPREPERRWYGWQTLLVDAGSFSLLIAGGYTNSGPESNTTGGVLTGFGSLGYLFGPAIVHAAHGHWGKAGGSFGIRAGSVVLLIAGVASCFDESLFHGNSCDSNVLLWLGVIGFFGAPVIDAAVLAHEDVTPGDEARLTLAPWFDPSRRTSGFTLRGAF